MPLLGESLPSPELDHENRRHSSGRKRRHQTEPPHYRSFALAHPARGPNYIDKTHVVKHLKSRQFLQIQKVSPETNHYVPDIDVISFAAPKDPIRLVSALRGLLEGKISLRDGQLLRFNKDDVLLTRYREDDSESVTGSHPPRKGSIMAPLEKIVGREVRAVLRKDHKIILDDGSLWTAANHQNRSFEFTSTDAQGMKTVTRWVLSKRRISGIDDHPQASSTQSPEAMFHFSIIRPNTRKHAVLASLTPSSLQIKESYYEPATSFGTSEDFKSGPKVVEEGIRNIITVTAVWVVLTLGWSPAYAAHAGDQQDASWRAGACVTTTSLRSCSRPGANTGLGFEAAVKYVALGADKLIIAVRSATKGEEARRRILERTGRNSSEVDIAILIVDLSDFASVKQFAHKLGRETRYLDVALLNAGLANSRFETCPAGWEMAVQVNVLSTALMAVLLLPLLRSTAAARGKAVHLTFVNSHGHRMVQRDWYASAEGSLMKAANDKTRWDVAKSYSMVKLMGMAVMQGVARGVTESWASSPNHKSPDIVVNAVCPSLCKTDLGRKFGTVSQISGFFFQGIFARTAEEGSRSLVSATALGPESHGRFWHHDILAPIGELAKDEDLMKQTWAEV